MASLRDLKKRLESTKATGQLAGAMRTVGTVKYSKTSSALAAFAPYAEACRHIAGSASGRREESEDYIDRSSAPPMYVLVSGNRGLCGGVNHNLFTYFDALYPKARDMTLVTCGRMAAEHCREKGIVAAKEIALSDIPTFDEARELALYLLSEYSSGAASEVIFVYQRFLNMLKQEPDTRRFLPAGDAEEGEGTETIFLPDEATVREELIPLCLASDVYSLLVSSAAGAHAATVMAMRSAYDNANKTAQRLETQIHRRRQAEVTQSVLETSGDTEEMRF